MTLLTTPVLLLLSGSFSDLRVRFELSRSWEPEPTSSDSRLCPDDT